MVEGIDVSVIVPMYNCESWISKLINDLQNQTFTNFEVLLIDDGSTDHTFEICSEVCRKDHRFSIFRQKNSGPGAARNVGILHSKGNYIRFIDADDRIDKNSLETLIQPLLSDSSLDLVIGHISYGHKKWQSELRGKHQLPTLIEDFFGIFYGISPNKVYKSSIIKNNKLVEPEDIRWCEDYLFNLSYYPFVENVYYVLDHVYTYLIFEGSLVSQVKLIDRNAIEARCIRELKHFLLGTKSYRDQKVFCQYSESVAYLLYSQMCNIVQKKMGYDQFSKDCLTEENKNFWINYKNYKKNFFYRIVKSLFRLGFPYGLFLFIQLKEFLKGCLKND